MEWKHVHVFRAQSMHLLNFPSPLSDATLERLLKSTVNIYTSLQPLFCKTKLSTRRMHLHVCYQKCSFGQIKHVDASHLLYKESSAWLKLL